MLCVDNDFKIISFRPPEAVCMKGPMILGNCIMKRLVATKYFQYTSTEFQVRQMFLVTFVNVTVYFDYTSAEF